MPLRQTLQDLLDPGSTPASKAVDLTIQGLVVLSILSFSVETLPNLEPRWKLVLHYFEIFCVAVFSVEYLLRVYAAPDRKRFIFSFYGVVDLLAIVPFYLSVGVDLRSVRGFRLLRLFRVFKLFRYNRALRLYLFAFKEIRAELALYLGATMFLIYLSAIGIYYFENPSQPEKFQSVFHCLWWAVATLSTVGYGDIYPITLGGRLFTFVVLMLGLGVVAVPAGLLSAALSKASLLSERELTKELAEDPEL
ncbi:MAG: ion transporter [bacterium]|nr:ion transporter [bacterium]